MAEHVIIGNGVAGIKAAETIRKLDPDCVDLALLQSGIRLIAKSIIEILNRFHLYLQGVSEVKPPHP